MGWLKEGCSDKPAERYGATFYSAPASLSQEWFRRFGGRIFERSHVTLGVAAVNDANSVRLGFLWTGQRIVSFQRRALIIIFLAF